MMTYPECKINNQTILQEQVDENYEPTQEEIREYAVYIGIDPDREPHLLWLAKEGIVKPLPTGWKPCQDEHDELYYFNFDTGKSLWEHPCDEIYKARVVEERQRKTSGSNLLDTNAKGTLTQTGKSTSTVSDYISGGRKASTTGNNTNTPIAARNQAPANNFDSEYVNSDVDDIEEELMNSGDDDDEDQSGYGFRKGIDFGIDPTLSAEIQKRENKGTIENTARESDMAKSSVNDDREQTQLRPQPQLAAEPGLFRLSRDNGTQPATMTDPMSTPREDAEMIQLRKRLEQSANEEKLQIMEENRLHIARITTELRTAKEKEERTLREKMKADLASIENELRESTARERKSLESRKREELNDITKAIEREKDEHKKKLRESMQIDMNVYKGTLEKQANADAQLRSLQDKHKREINGYEERLRQTDNEYENKIDDLTRRYEQVKADRDKLEKHLKEKDNLSSTFQRSIDQLRADKESVERKLKDAEVQLKAVDNSHRQVQASLARKSLSNGTKHKAGEDDDDDNDDDENSYSELNGRTKNGLHDGNDYDDERLSDTDSAVVEMEQTLKELRKTQLECMSLLPMSNVNDKTSPFMKTTTIDFSKLSVADVSPAIRNMRTINRDHSRMYESLETMPNHLLTSTDRWSNSNMSTLGGNNTNSLLAYQTLNRYPPTVSNPNHWSSQTTLVTREAVLKAARSVFAPSVIDQLSSNTRSSTH